MELTIYEKIKNRRLELGYSQDELAKRMGYKSRSTINKIESGQVDISRNKIAKFAEVLQVTPSYLMGWDDEQQEYYIDPVVNAKAEYARVQEGILLDAAKDLSDEDLDYVVDLVKRLRGKWLCLVLNKEIVLLWFDLTLEQNWKNFD